MNRVEFKRRLDGLRRLPITVHAACRAVLLLKDQNTARKALIALVLSDPCLAARILRAGAGHTLPKSASAAIRRIDDATLRRLILLAASEALFPAVTEPHYEVNAARRAIRTAVFAERLAARLESVSAQDAYLAGLLADVGTLALASLEPDAYRECLRRRDETPEPETRTEKQTLGFDHTQIGKWLAERWRFPDAIAQAVWLHHHPATALEGTRFAARLIEVTGLAAKLARLSERDGSPDESLYTRAERLGIARDALDSVFADGREAAKHSLAFLDGAPTDLQRASDELRAILYEFLDATPDGLASSADQGDKARFLDALHRMDTRLRPHMSVGEILDVFVDAVRQGVGLAPGVCCVIDTDGRHLHGKRWHTATGPVNSMLIDLEATDALSPDLQGALRTLGFGQGRRGWTGAGLLDVSQKGGLIVVPLIAEGRSLGQVLFEVESAGDRLGEALLANLTALAGACARAVARQHEEERLDTQNEDLILSLRDAPPVREPAASEPLVASEDRVLVQRLAEAVGRPLTEILLRVRQLDGSSDSGTQTDTVRSIARDGERLSGLLADLRAFGKPLQPKVEPAALNQVVHQLILTIEDEYAASGVRIIERTGDDLPRVMCDREQMQRVLKALLANAREAMAPGGGTATVETARADDDFGIRLRVSDTGSGISAENLPRVFAPLFSTKAKEEHSGLGLSLCRSVVEGHGGSMEIASQVGEGTTVTLVLPAKTTTAEPLPADEASPPEPVKLPRVLVVDDDEGVREILKRTLQMRGCLVETASDGVEAMESITGGPVDLLLLDICMPRKDGLTVLQELEARQAAFPVIVMTGSTRSNHIEEAMKRGARTCLRKPFELKQLLAEVESAVAEGRG